MKHLKSLFAILTVTTALAFGASAQTQLQGLDGTLVDLDRQNKIVILALGASWLPLSEDQVKFTNALAKKYSGQDVTVYFIATDSLTKPQNAATNEQLRKFAGDSKLAVTLLRDPDGVVIRRKYAIDQLPTFVILDRSGAVVGKPIGGIDPKYDITVPISARVDKLL